MPALKKHLRQLIDIYGHIYLVNLVNHKGHEFPIKDAFEKDMLLAASDDQQITNNAHYVYFDFHTECRKMRFDRISVLLDRLAAPLDSMGWFHSITPPPSATFAASTSAQVQVVAKQNGVIRSNCMDCLDRTNVTQSALGKWALNRQLRSAGVLSVKESVDDHPEFMTVFRHGKPDSKRMESPSC